MFERRTRIEDAALAYRRAWGKGSEAVLPRLVDLLARHNPGDLERLGTLNGSPRLIKLAVRACLRIGQPDRAVRIASSDPNTSKTSESLAWRVDLLERLGQSDRAETLLRAETTRRPESVESWMALLRHQSRRGHAEAEAEAEDVASTIAEAKKSDQGRSGRFRRGPALRGRRRPCRSRSRLRGRSRLEAGRRRDPPDRLRLQPRNGPLRPGGSPPQASPGPRPQAPRGLEAAGHATDSPALRRRRLGASLGGPRPPSRPEGMARKIVWSGLFCSPKARERTIGGGRPNSWKPWWPTSRASPGPRRPLAPFWPGSTWTPARRIEPPGCSAARSTSRTATPPRSPCMPRPCSGSAGSTWPDRSWTDWRRSPPATTARLA